MPKPAKGEVRFSAGIWRARITLKGKRRLDVELPTCRDEFAATERALLLTEQARHLRLAGKVETAGAEALLRELGAATDGTGVSDAIMVIGELCGASTLPARLEGSTFAEVAKRWTSGELAQDWPDHVKAKDSAEDERKIAFLNALDVGGVKLGELPLSRFKLDHAESAMRQLPKTAKRPATRRHYAQCIARVLALAVYPLRIIARNPLPKGFMPKAGKPPGFSFLYPAEEAALMACAAVPVEERLLFGFLSREGMRAGEAVRLTWNEVDLERGVVTLDRNKTDEARAWALDAGVGAALAAWRKSKEPAADGLVFVDQDGNPFEINALARLLRRRLWEAEVRRPELHTKGENRGLLRAHDLRGTFVTLALANGRSEAWVQDRTGHTSSAMLNRYRRAARTAAELGLGQLVPLVSALPEVLAGSIAHALPTGQLPVGQSDDMPVDGSGMISAVPKVGLEPTRCFQQRILSPSRLPIPPLRLVVEVPVVASVALV